MLLKIIRSFTGGRAAVVQLVPLADLPPLADPAVVEVLREAHVALSRDAGRAAAVLGRTCARLPHDALANALHGVFLSHAGFEIAADRAFEAARQSDAGRPLEERVGYHFFVLGVHYVNEKNPGSAERCLQLARRLMPEAAAPLEMLGLNGYLSGDTAAARAYFDRALACATADERGALEINRLIDTLPQVGLTASDLAQARAWFEAELDRLLGDRPAIAEPLAAIHRTPFFLCYQGRNDRSANTRLAELFLRASPGLGYVAPHLDSPRPRAGARPVVGFVSAHLGRHSVGVWYRDMVQRIIEGERFDTVLFAYGEHVDDRLKAAAEQRGAFVPVGSTLEEARARIAAREPDVLLYTDIGIHPFFYFLAFSRLAPVQALLIGHPCTSGIPAMDYFVSNIFQDSEQAQAHYSERLVRLSKIAVHVARSEPPAAPLSRADLGWTEGTRYYVCPMMLQKLHPDFDATLAEILRRDPQGEVVLFSDVSRALWQLRLEERFARDMPDVAGRIGFRPFAPKREFLSILLAADCLLDTFHFSGGVTSYVAISLGLPLITLPGALFRSRMTAGIYRQAGIKDCIAQSPEHYVELALAFAADPARRAAYREKILAAESALFETVEAVDVLAEWIASVAEAPA